MVYGVLKHKTQNTKFFRICLPLGALDPQVMHSTTTTKQPHKVMEIMAHYNIKGIKVRKNTRTKKNMNMPQQFQMQQILWIQVFQPWDPTPIWSPLNYIPLTKSMALFLILSTSPSRSLAWLQTIAAGSLCHASILLDTHSIATNCSALYSRTLYCLSINHFTHRLYPAV